MPRTIDDKVDVFDANGEIHERPREILTAGMKFTYRCQHIPTGHTTHEMAYFEDQRAFVECINRWNAALPALWRYSFEADKENDMPETTRCIYCGRKGPWIDENEKPPEVDDDLAWAEEATHHAADCIWLRTRAHRLATPPPAVYDHDD